MLQLTFNPGLTLIGFRTTQPRITKKSFVTSESLEAAEEAGHGVLAASGIGDSVRQGTIGVVN